MRPVLISALCLTCLSLIMPSGLAQQSGETVYPTLRVEQTQAEMRSLRTSNAELGARITGLEADNATLYGKLETLEFLLSQSRDQINDMQADDAEIGRLIGRLERRLTSQTRRIQQLEQDMTVLKSRLGQTEQGLTDLMAAPEAEAEEISASTRLSAPANQAEQITGVNPDGPEAATQPASGELSQPVSRTSSASSEGPAQPVAESAETSAMPAGTNDAGSVSASEIDLPQGSLGSIPASALPGEAGPLFALAKSRLLQFDYAGAEEAFRAFLGQFGDDPQAGEAQYWLAEVLYQQEAYPEAGQAYTTMIRSFPDDPRAPEALAKLARSMRLVGDTEQACAALDLLPTRYPDASGVTRSLAAGERVRADCDG